MTTTNKRKPGQPKNRTDAQREDQLEAIAKYTRRGYSQHQIAAMIGVSQTQICYDQKILKARWRERQVEEYNALVQEKVEQLREVRREAWEAWERSKEDWVRVVEEHGSDDDEEDGEGKKKQDKADPAVSLGFLRRIVTKAGRLPDNQYLATIVKTLEVEGKLTGLGTDVDMNGNKPGQVVINFGQASEMAGPPRTVDPVLEELKRVESLPSAPQQQQGVNGHARK